LEAVELQDVDRPIADDVIGQMHTVRRFREASLRNFHATNVESVAPSAERALVFVEKVGARVATRGQPCGGQQTRGGRG